MRIAVVRADGSPLVTPMWFIYEDDAIYFTPRAHSEWYGCLKRDPRVALSYRRTAAAVSQGRRRRPAELIHDLGADALWRERYRRIAQRYVPPEAAEAYIADTIDNRARCFACACRAQTCAAGACRWATSPATASGINATTSRESS